MAKKLTTDTYIDLIGGIPKRQNPGGPLRNFTFDTNPGLVQQNTLVTPWAGRQMIIDKFQNDWNEPARQNQPIAVEFDRQSLLLILSQNGCEGLRFSFCHFNGVTTLVAFGVSETGVLIREDMFKEDFVPVSNSEPPPGSEQGHGITLGEFKQTVEGIIGGFTNEWGKAADIFFQENLKKRL